MWGKLAPQRQREHFVPTLETPARTREMPIGRNDEAERTHEECFEKYRMRVSLRKDTILFLCYQLFSERFFISRNAKNRRLVASFRCHRKRAELDLVDILQKQANFSQKYNNFSHFLHWFETGNHDAPKQHPTEGEVPCAFRLSRAHHAHIRCFSIFAFTPSPTLSTR